MNDFIIQYKRIGEYFVERKYSNTAVSAKALLILCPTSYSGECGFSGVEDFYSSTLEITDYGLFTAEANRIVSLAQRNLL